MFWGNLGSQQITVSNPNPTATQIFNVPFPGGGFSVGMDMHSDGSMLNNVDIFGGYVGSTVPGSTWQQLATQGALPSTYTTPPTPFLHGSPVWMRFDPSNSQNIWMMYLANAAENALCTLLKSTNKGNIFSSTGFSFFSIANWNGDSTRFEGGQRIAIDPNNSSIVWAGTYTALFVSLNSGTSFTQVSGGTLPAATGAPGYVGMQYDPNTANRLLVGVTGSGVYVTTNANLGASSTWTQVSNITSPGHGKMGSDSNYYFNETGEGNAIVRISSANVVTTLTPSSSGCDCFAVDPNNSSRAISLRFGQLTIGGPVNGTPSWSTNTAFSIASSTQEPWYHTAHSGGSGDTGPKSPGDVFFDPFNATSATSLTIGTGTKTFTDVPTGLNISVGDTLRVSNTGAINTNWMLGTVTTYTTGNLTISVLSSNPGGYLGTATGGSGTFAAWTITKERIWYSTGTGIFYLDQLFTSGTYNFVPSTWGMEDMVTKMAIWPPGGSPCVTFADRNTWNVTNNPFNATVGQAGYGPSFGTELQEGSSCDWATSAPTTIVLFGSSVSAAKSTSNGATGTWTSLTNSPSGGGVCGIAVADANNMVAFTGSGVFYTTNGGSSAWLTMPTVPTGSWGGLAGVFGVPPRPICADRVNAKIFYGYSASNTTVYKMDLTSGTAVVTAQHTGALTSISNGPLKIGCPPNIGTFGVNGHVFYTPGFNESQASYTSLSTVTGFVPSNFAFLVSSNSGVSWTAVPNVQMCQFGFGAPLSGGGGYPSVYIVGWLSGTYGIYRCDNFDQFFSTPTNLVWTNVGTYARGWVDLPTTIEGDPNQWGRFIIGHNGSSCAMGQVGTPTWP